MIALLFTAPLLLLTMAANPAPAAPKGGSVGVEVDAELGADGSLRGTLTSTWSAACARELSARLARLEPAARTKLLAALAGPLLAGHLKPGREIKGLGQAGADLVLTYAIEAPRFAPPESPGSKALSLGLPLLSPYELLKTPAEVMPVTINHDISIKLPPSTVPLELPSAFSTITPDAGRYVIYFDRVRAGTVVLKVRRELEISGTVPARLAELAEGVTPRDAARLSIVASKPASSR